MIKNDTCDHSQLTTKSSMDWVVAGKPTVLTLFTRKEFSLGYCE